MKAGGDEQDESRSHNAGEGEVAKERVVDLLLQDVLLSNNDRISASKGGLIIDLVP